MRGSDRSSSSAAAPVNMTLNTLPKKTAPTASGHSAVGGWASILLILLMLGQATSGLFITDDILFSGPYNSIVSSALADTLGSFHHLNFNFKAFFLPCSANARSCISFKKLNLFVANFFLAAFCINIIAFCFFSYTK